MVAGLERMFEPIPMPFRVRWREFRIRVLPAVIFILGIAGVAWLWNAPAGVGQRWAHAPDQQRQRELANRWAGRRAAELELDALSADHSVYSRLSLVPKQSPSTVP